jgi:hypothetical protein
MTDFGDHFYGLGAIDMSGATPGTSGFGEPAIGHAGIDYGVNSLLVPSLELARSPRSRPRVARSARLRR